MLKKERCILQNGFEEVRVGNERSVERKMRSGGEIRLWGERGEGRNTKGLGLYVL